MGNILSFEHYQMLEESSQQFSDELDILTEGIMDAIKNPIKYRKIKNSAKKLQKVLVKKALSEVEYEKKKKGLPVEKKNVLKAASDAKSKSADDLASGINDQMDDLATTDGLKAVSSMAKNNAKISAAEVSMKSASDSEKAAIKQQVKKLRAAAAEAKAKLEAAAETEKKKKEKEKKKAEPVDTTDDVEVQPKTDDAKIDKLEQDIKAYEKNISSAKDTIKSKKADLETAKEDKTKSTAPESFDSKIGKIEGRIRQEENDITELKNKIAAIRKQLDKLNTP